MRIYKFWIIHLTAHPRDNLSSERARPIVLYSTKYWVNKSEARLFDEQLGFERGDQIIHVTP